MYTNICINALQSDDSSVLEKKFLKNEKIKTWTEILEEKFDWRKLPTEICHQFNPTRSNT